MTLLELRRSAHRMDGTPGTLSFPQHSGVFQTLELPDRANEQWIACIPAGEYDAERIDHPRFGTTLQLLDVPNRSGILIHAGNYAGASDRGYRCDSYGCILLGLGRFSRPDGQRGLIYSRKAMTRFRRLLEEDPGEAFRLKIHAPPP